MAELRDGHSPRPGPDYWDWRCLRCDMPVADHPNWWQRRSIRRRTRSTGPTASNERSNTMTEDTSHLDAPRPADWEGEWPPRRSSDADLWEEVTKSVNRSEWDADVALAELKKRHSAETALPRRTRFDVPIAFLRDELNDQDAKRAYLSVTSEESGLMLAAQIEHCEALADGIQALIALRSAEYAKAGERLVSIFTAHEHEFEDRCHCGLLASEYFENKASPND